MTTPTASSPAPAAPPVRPCVVVTVYGDLTGARALPMIDRLSRAAAEGDLAACIHDPPGRDDEQLARAIRGRGLRLWYAWGVDPDTRLAPLDAAAQTRRRARLAAERGAEVVELNGEAAWRTDTAEVGDAHPRATLARLMIAAVREGAPSTAVSWTSYDHVLWHRLPWAAIAGAGGVDLFSPQYYAADTRDADPETHHDARARLQKAGEQLRSLVERGAVRTDLGPGGAGWAPYGQVHGLTMAGAAVVLDAAPITRAWALPSRCDAAGLNALEGVLRARRLTGHRGAGAVRRAQERLGVAVDGSLGPKTLAALRSAM